MLKRLDFHSGVGRHLGHGSFLRMSIQSVQSDVAHLLRPEAWNGLERDFRGIVFTPMFDVRHKLDRPKTDTSGGVSTRIGERARSSAVGDPVRNIRGPTKNGAMERNSAGYAHQVSDNINAWAKRFHHDGYTPHLPQCLLPCHSMLSILRQPWGWRFGSFASFASTASPVSDDREAY